MSRAHLSAIELAILKALANGMQSKEIAALVGRRRATVEWYVRMLLVKLDARSRPHLVARALCSGAIGREDIDTEAI
ncbi:MAG: helix-turn-helix transcriptional regulator [Candidatus Eremiobacteraeota bacterium]|nr:helix-turn-helix transcriptional regulator [Candidatus Eremiobacteraeota bacterium]